MHLRHRPGTSDAVPLVLVHQIASSSQMFERFMANAPERLSLIAVDLPGFGASDPLDGEATLERWAAALDEALDAYGVERFDLFGHHGGAAVAIALAATAGGRIRRLALSGPPRYDAETRTLMESVFDSLEREAERSGVVAATSGFITGIAGEAGAPAVPREVALTLLAHDQLRSYRVLKKVDLDGLIARIEQPTLVMVGGRDLLEPAARTVHSMIADSAFRVVPDAGIYIFDEQASTAGSILLEFITT
jgi:pimeloyl-ACP methyl ester carboxylesterase